MAPRCPGRQTRELPGEFDYARAPVAPKPRQLGRGDGGVGHQPLRRRARRGRGRSARSRARRPARPRCCARRSARRRRRGRSARRDRRGSSPDLYAEPVRHASRRRGGAVRASPPSLPHHPTAGYATPKTAAPSRPVHDGAAREEIERTLRGGGDRRGARAGADRGGDRPRAAADAPLHGPRPGGAHRTDAEDPGLAHRCPPGARRSPWSARAAAARAPAAPRWPRPTASTARCPPPASRFLRTPRSTEPALREARTQGLLLLDTPTVSGADPSSIYALAELLEQLAARSRGARAPRHARRHTRGPAAGGAGPTERRRAGDHPRRRDRPTRGGGADGVHVRAGPRPHAGAG